MLKGLFIAMATPFGKDGSLNTGLLRELVKEQVSRGSSGLVPCATTSESPTLSASEQKAMIEIAVENSPDEVTVIAGCGTNSTEKSIENIKRAADLGADMAMTSAPYYNKPTQEGLYRHFRELADRGGLPLLLYNVPGRTGVNIEPETVERLAGHENIAGIKEASGDLEQISEIIVRCGGRIDLLSGDDALTLPVLSVGGKGVVSVLGNITPSPILEMISSFERGDLRGALDIHRKLLPLCQAMFMETNPVPVKEAMNMLGTDMGGVRLPLAELSAGSRDKLRKVLRDSGLLK
jgi:4-hydroxy-tetrahydrodipicolinate synthase